MNDLKPDDLNQTLVKKNPDRVLAMLDFANLVNSMYGNLSKPHPYLIGDCVLAKLNLLRHGKRVRPSSLPIVEKWTVIQYPEDTADFQRHFALMAGERQIACFYYIKSPVDNELNTKHKVERIIAAHNSSLPAPAMKEED